MFPFVTALSTTTPSSSMADFLSMLTQGLTSILSGVNSVVNTITASPFLLFTVIFLFAGGVIGIIGRILSRN